MRQRNINIFISSTFNDMQSERDYIRKYVVPRLKKNLSKYHVNIQVTDLRWGVDTQSVEEDHREEKVLHVCLKAIQNSRPYFIALLGERYGWVPPIERMEKIKNTLPADLQQALGDVSKSMSVTEMEILLGAIGEQSLMSHSFFCFRKPSSYQYMPKKTKELYIDALSKDEEIRHRTEKLEKLKTHIREECKQAGTNNIIEYKAQWLKETKKRKGRFGRLKTFGDELYSLIYDDIEQELKIERKAEVLSQEQDEEKELFWSFVTSRGEDFQGRRKELRDFVKLFINAREATTLLSGMKSHFLTGFSGCGKSSLFSKVYLLLDRLSSRYSFFILAHAAGISQRSILVEQMIISWCEQMEHFLDSNSTVEDLLKEETLFAFDKTRKLLQRFRNLLARLKVKGKFPIILIDSLDSFEDSYENQELLKDLFSSIPPDVPFLCTTLPGYTDQILKNHPNYQCLDMDTFSVDDARQVFRYVLRKNYKELPSELQEQLLSIKKADNSLAYESPLWLRMAIDILMELGEEDFNRIHNIQQLKEDEKIESYLKSVINSFPADADQLFFYFIELTCKYFNPQLTRKVLNYIAIAQFGISEDNLAKLIARKWNPLDFNSLLCWMHDLIQCNNNDHRWFFSHAILRGALMSQDSASMKACRKRFYDYLVNNISQDDVLAELCHQLIVRQDYQLLHKQKERLDYSHVFTETLVREFASDQAATLQFIRTYIDRYFIEDQELICDMEFEFLREGDDKEITLYTTTALEISEYHLSCFTDEVLKEDIQIVEDYFAAPIYIEQELDLQKKIKPYQEFISQLHIVYQKVKVFHKEDLMKVNLDYTYFRYWDNYICKLFEICEYDHQYEKELNQNIADFKAELAWWCQYYGAPRCDFKVNNMVRTPLVKKSHTTEYVEEQPKHQKTTMPAIELPEEEEDERMVCAVSMDLPPSDEEEWQWRNSPEWKDEWDDENDEEEEEEDDVCDAEPPSEESISKVESELDELIKTREEFPTDTTEMAQQVLMEIISLFQRLALMNLQAGNIEKGNNLIRQLGHLLAGSILNMGDHYVLRDRLHEDIVEYGELLVKAGRKDEQMELTEIVSKAIFHSYYHHIDGRSQRRIFKYMLELYEEQGMTDKKIALLKKMFEIALRNHIERMFDSSECCFHDPSYVRPVFKDYLNELQKSKRIQEADIALAQWIDLCLRNYVDEEDTAGYEYLTEAYDMQASLHGEAPAERDTPPTINEDYTQKRPNQGVIIADWYDEDDYGDELHRSALYDLQGQELTPPGRYLAIAAFGQQLLTPAYTVDNRAGYIDRSGKEVTSFDYEKCRPFSYGLGAVCKKWAQNRNRWGFVNIDGEEVIPTQYADVGDFHEGLAWVCLDNGKNKGFGYRNGKFGFINTNGDLVISAIYDDVSSFYEGRALVWKDEQAFHINQQGEKISDL